MYLLIGAIIHSSKPLAFLVVKEVFGVLVLSLIYNIYFALTSGPLGWLIETFLEKPKWRKWCSPISSPWL